MLSIFFDEIEILPNVHIELHKLSKHWRNTDVVSVLDMNNTRWSRMMSWLITGRCVYGCSLYIHIFHITDFSL